MSKQRTMTISKILSLAVSVGIVFPHLHGAMTPPNRQDYCEIGFGDDFTIDWAQDASAGFSIPSDDLSASATRDDGDPAVDCANEFTPEDILNALMVAKIPNLLSFNTYCRTNPTVIRPLLDLPDLQPSYDRCDGITFYGTAFYTQMRNMYLTAQGPCLRDYLAILSDGDLINALDDFINIVMPGANVPNVIPLFNNIRLDMRRVGAILGITACPGNWRLSMAFPFYYLENNFFLAQPDLDRLNSQRYFSDVSVGSMPENPDLFVRRHLINDKVGISDIRYMIDYSFGCPECYQARVGGQVTLPLNLVIAQGIFGNCFNRLAPQPPINAQYIAFLVCVAGQSGTPQEEALANQAKVTLANLALSYGVAYLDWLTATVATNPIGQNTPSVGVYLQPEFMLSAHIRLGFLVQYDYWASQHMPRTFNTVFDAQAIRTTDYTADPDQALSNLLFLQQQAQNVLYPPVFPVKIKQGDVVKARMWMAYERSNYVVTGGADLWYQAREKLTICSPGLSPRINTQTAQRPAALQIKLYGVFDTIFRDTEVSCYAWKLGLRADVTVYNAGIGNDWLIGINAVGDF